MYIGRRLLISVLEGWGTAQQEAEEWWWQKCSSCCEKCAIVGLRITGRWVARICNDLSEGPKSFGTNSTSTIHKSRTASSKQPRKHRVHRWIKYKSKFLISAVPAPWNMRTDLRKRPDDKSDAPAEMRGNMPRISLSSMSRKKPDILFVFRWVGFAGRINSKAGGEREFVVDSGASMQMVSRKDLNSAELETVRISKSPTTVVTANGEVPTKEEATLYVRRIGFIRDSSASRRYTGSSFTRENSANLVAWSARMAAGVQARSSRWKYSRKPRAASKSGIG